MRLMKPVKHFFRQHWPKLVTAIVGCGIFGLSYMFSAQVQTLLNNIAATLISIPLVFLFYEQINEKNHRRTIEYVYQFVDNTAYEIVDDAVEAVRLLLEGYTTYFKAGCAEYGDSAAETWVRMTKYGQVRATEDDDSWPDEYSHEEYNNDMMAACDEMEDEDYIFEFDNASIIPHLLETAYLGYQIYALDFDTICEELDDLVKNPLVLKHLEEERLIILLQLSESLKMLSNAVHNKERLFFPTDRKIANFRGELFGNFVNQLGYTGGCDLYYDDGTFSTILDQDIIINADKEQLTTVFRLIPSQVQLLGAQINEFMLRAEQWRKC